VDKRAGDDWAGTILTERGLSETQAKNILFAWCKEGVLTKSRKKTASRNMRDGFEVDAAKFQEMRQQARGPINEA
jgi:hypothetical protein